MFSVTIYLESGPKSGPGVAQSNIDEAMIHNRPRAVNRQDLRLLRSQSTLPPFAAPARSQPSRTHSLRTKHLAVFGGLGFRFAQVAWRHPILFTKVTRQNCRGMKTTGKHDIQNRRCLAAWQRVRRSWITARSFRHGRLRSWFFCRRDRRSWIC